MVIEYAGTYGGPPSGDLPWPLFVLLVRGADRFNARQMLNVMNGVAWGAAKAFSGDMKLEVVRMQIEKCAYPKPVVKEQSDA